MTPGGQDPGRGGGAGGDGGARHGDDSWELLRLQVEQHLLFCREMGVKELDVRLPADAGTARAAGPAAAGDAAAGAARAGARDLPGAGSDDAPARLESLRVEDLGDCRRCKLCDGRTHIVFGDGSPRASVMFVGEGPGFEEDRQGLPFVGRAGQLLNQIIKAMGFERRQVYIANVVKCRPPDNRTPQPDEVAACTPFLYEQIAIIRPRVIVALGSPASQALLGTSAGITKIRGTFRDYQGIRVMPTFHPAYLLRNPSAKRQVWEDMQQVMAYLAA